MPQVSSRLAKIERLIQSTNNREADPLIVLRPSNGQDDFDLWWRVARDGVTGVHEPEPDSAEYVTKRGRQLRRSARATLPQTITRHLGRQEHKIAASAVSRPFDLSNTNASTSSTSLP